MVSMPLFQTRDMCGFHLSICGMVLLVSGSRTDSPVAHAAPGLTAVFMQLGAGQRET